MGTSVISVVLYFNSNNMSFNGMLFIILIWLSKGLAESEVDFISLWSMESLDFVMLTQVLSIDQLFGDRLTFTKIFISSISRCFYILVKQFASFLRSFDLPTKVF